MLARATGSSPTCGRSTEAPSRIEAGTDMATVARESSPSAPPWTAALHDWVTTVDHKKIGILYVLMSLVFLVIAGVEALLMRWQLLVPRSTFLGPDTFNQLFTMHGTTMVFFVGMPI